MFTRAFLSDFRQRALRRGVWFRALDRVERGILSLTVRVVDRVESEVLGVVLVKILSKLRDSFKSEFARNMEEYGLRRAHDIVVSAIRWGDDAAKEWVADLGFVRYLTILQMNRPSGWGL